MRERTMVYIEMSDCEFSEMNAEYFKSIVDVASRKYDEITIIIK